VSKWPVKVKQRNKVFARIYRSLGGRDSYPVAWKAAGQRKMKSSKAYLGKDGARAFADELVGKGSFHNGPQRGNSVLISI